MKKKVMAFQPKTRLPKFAKPSRPDPAEQLKQTPTALLLTGMNAMLEELESRGVSVTDYDQPGRKLYQFKHIRGRHVFLAAEADDLETAD